MPEDKTKTIFDNILEARTPEDLDDILKVAPDIKTVGSAVDIHEAFLREMSFAASIRTAIALERIADRLEEISALRGPPGNPGAPGLDGSDCV